ncbi:hypothetical protein [Streptomyces sp. HUAS ZL42]
MDIEYSIEALQLFKGDEAALSGYREWVCAFSCNVVSCEVSCALSCLVTS